MKKSWPQRLRAAVVMLAAAGLVCPRMELHAGAPAGSAVPAETALPDVRLDAAGRLWGVVVDAQGHSQSGARVVLCRDADGAMQVGRTDSEGRFVLSARKGGTYRLQTSDGVSVCRVWTSEGAPPGAAPTVLVVNDRLVLRGQQPIGKFFTSDPILVATLVAAAIAIPIAVHKSRDDTPPGS